MKPPFISFRIGRCFRVSMMLLCLAIVIPVQAQQRDRLAELNVACRNEFVTYPSVAPDGSLWMATMCGEIYRADNIHSPWHILKEESLDGDMGETFENIVAFDGNTAVIVGRMWGDYFKRTTTGGRSWDKVKYDSKKFEWFHSVWRGEGGLMWTGSQDGYMAFSDNSGRSFTKLRSFDVKMYIDDIYMLSADSGWIASRDEGLFSTSNNWRNYHRHSTPFGKGISRIRPWKGYLIVSQGRKSYYTATDEVRWQRTPLPLKDFEVDTATRKMWAIDDHGEVVLMEDIDQWKPMGVSALFIIGIYDGRLYCRVNGGVLRVGADGAVDPCPFLTADRALKKPELTLKQGNLLWGYDDKSVYLRDSKGWYRVARPLNIAGLTPDPDREDRVVVFTEAGENFSIDTAGRVEPYIYRQPLAAFVKQGLRSVEITTYKTLGYGIHKETIGFLRDGSHLTETTRTITKESYDPHIKGGHATETFPMAADKDSNTRQLPVASIEEALLSLGERYHLYPTPMDFGLNDTLLDLREVYAKRNVYSTNKYGYNIIFVNQANDILTVWGNTSAYLDLGGSTHYPWMLPMFVYGRDANFVTYQPVLWQALREAMPDSMQLKNYLDNSNLHPRHTFQSGDLIFMYNSSSDMEKAITASTGNYSHVALVECDSAGDVWIIEATPKNGVQRKPFKDFQMGAPTRFFDVYRLVVPFDTAAVITRAKDLVGKPYDEAFLPDNDAYYCSELVQVAFGDLFESKPMNWRDADGQLLEYWVKHFEKLGAPVPEGVPGTNPTAMSQSPLLKRLQ